MSENTPSTTPETGDASVTPDVPTPEKTMSEKALEALQGDGLTDTEKAYLNMVAEQGVGQFGPLVQNPDGTYGPMNDRDPELAEAKKESKKEFRTGYQFKDPKAVARWRAPDGSEVTVTADQLTHRLAQRMIMEAPSEFRALIIRGFHDVDGPYWK